MSDANRTRLAIVKEAVLGTIPANPPLRRLRITGANLQYGTKTVVSNELREDRQIPDLIRVGYEPGGSVPFELSHGALDDLMEGVLGNVWSARYTEAFNEAASNPISAVDGATHTFTVAGKNFAEGDIVRATGFVNPENNGIFVAGIGSGAGTLVLAAGLVDEAAPPAGARLKVVGYRGDAAEITATATGLSGVPAGLALVRGEWIKIGGAVAATQFAAGNGWARVGADQAGTDVVLDIKPADWAVDAAAGKTIELYVGEYLRNGTNAYSYSLEEQFQDIAVPEYHYYYGMRVSKLQLQSQSQAIVTGSAEFMGMTAEITTARVGGATDKRAPTFDVMSSSSNAGFLMEGGARVEGPNYVVGTNLTIDASARRQNAQGSEGSIGIGLGRVQVGGQLDTYYGDKTILNKLRTGQATSYMAVFGTGDDELGKSGLLVDIPKLKFVGGDPTVQGVDTDRMLNMGFQGVAHPVLGYTIHAQKFEGFLG